MRTKLSFVSLSLLLFVSLALAGDPGQPDTVYFCGGNTLYFAKTLTDSTSTAFLRLAFSNDSNVHAITIPLAYVLGFAFFDSVTYTGSRVDYLQFKTVNFDTIADKVLLGAVPVEEDPIGPGRGLYATLWFTLENSLASVSFDTTFFPPSNQLYFANSASEIYTPVWAGAASFSAVTYVAGDADGNGNVDLADLIFLVNYIFHVGWPAPPIRAAADADGECDIDLEDVIYTANFIFRYNQGYPAPVPGCIFPACN